MKKKLNFKFTYIILGLLLLIGCMATKVIYVKISPEPSALTPSFSISFDEEFESEAIIKTLRISSESRDEKFPEIRDFFWVINADDYEEGIRVRKIVYGKLPKGFYDGVEPKPLEVNRQYHIEIIGPYPLSYNGFFQLKEMGNEIILEVNTEPPKPE